MQIVFGRKSDNMGIQSVIFDLDGTLLNTLDDLADASNRALVRLGFPTHPISAYRRFVGNGARLLCTRMLPPEHRSEAEIEQARHLFDEEYSGHMFDKTVPYPEIPALLDRLREQGIQMGIVSNKPDEFVQAIAQRYFPGYFQAVSGPRGGRTKPDPSGVLLLLDGFQVPPASTLYVGDSDVDMQTAHNAGTHSCGALWGFRGPDELRAAGAEHLAQSPLDILHCLS